MKNNEILKLLPKNKKPKSVRLPSNGRLKYFRMNNKSRTYARIGLVDTFFEIAADSFLEFRKDKKEFDLIISDGGELHEGIYIYRRMNDYIVYEDKLRKGTIKIILFLTTFLESYINDLGGIALGDNFVKDHLDKLSIISKWIVIPRLISGKEIDKGKSFFEDFKELVKWRNSLVHHKTKDATKIFESLKTEDVEKLKPIYELFDVSKSFKMVEELFAELDRIDKPGSHSIRIKRTLNNLKKRNETS